MYCDIHEMANCSCASDRAATRNQGVTRATNDIPFTKQELLDMIGKLLPFEERYFATEGSSLPRGFFIELAELTATEVAPGDGMVDINRNVIVGLGHKYKATSDSTGTRSGGGGTVTKPGLYQTYLALKEPNLDG